MELKQTVLNTQELNSNWFFSDVGSYGRFSKDTIKNGFGLGHWIWTWTVLQGLRRFAFQLTNFSLDGHWTVLMDIGSGLLDFKKKKGS